MLVSIVIFALSSTFAEVVGDDEDFDKVRRFTAGVNPRSQGRQDYNNTNRTPG